MRILIAGLARSGLNTAELLNKAGHRVWGTDSSLDKSFPPSEYPFFQDIETGGHKKFMKMDFDLLILSPGIPDNINLVKKFKKKGIRVTGELDFINGLIKKSVIKENGITGVTGTNGKTTTSELIGTIYGMAQEKCAVCGNNGYSVSKALLDNKDEKPFDSLVIEMSSFMIDRMGIFSPDILAILNMRPDHLDRYGTPEEYYRAKFASALSLKEKGTLIFNLLCPVTCGYIKKNLSFFKRKKIFLIGFQAQEPSLLKNTFSNAPGFGKSVSEDSVLNKHIFNDDLFEKIIYSSDSSTFKCAVSEKSINIEKFQLRGVHNIENALAAVAAAIKRGIGISFIEKGIALFQGVSHRMEEVLKIENQGLSITVVNDSKATNVDSALKALSSYNEEITLIAGGYDKGESMELFALEIIRHSVKNVILIGQTAKNIKSLLENLKFQGRLETAESLDNALKYAKDYSFFDMRKNFRSQVILFSPACASYGMFRDFEQRGLLFKESALRIFSDSPGSGGI
jgi:UDP-N-acetylmuramoylalanine--D-glutamate ligase